MKPFFLSLRTIRIKVSSSDNSEMCCLETVVFCRPTLQRTSETVTHIEVGQAHIGRKTQLKKNSFTYYNRFYNVKMYINTIDHSILILLFTIFLIIIYTFYKTIFREYKENNLLLKLSTVL